MTDCTYKINRKYHEIICDGHAVDVNEGDDRSVCASITVLLHTLAFDIEESSAMCDVKEIDVAPGYYHIKVVPIEGAEEQMEFLFGAIVNGIFMLSEDPKMKKHITFKVIPVEETPTGTESEI